MVMLERAVLVAVVEVEQQHQYRQQHPALPTRAAVVEALSLVAVA
tara:strand:+ start:731 stop:865 length:135 start_codon:yes stop_codon:yes gene_type:complete